MNEYKELVENLREFFNYNGEITYNDAADAIEQLIKQRNLLQKNLENILNDYADMINENYDLKHNCEECGIKTSDCISKLQEKLAQTTKERNEEREASDEWQHMYFEKAKECVKLKKERDAAIELCLKWE